MFTHNASSFHLVFPSLLNLFLNLILVYHERYRLPRCIEKLYNEFFLDVVYNKKSLEFICLYKGNKIYGKKTINKEVPLAIKKQNRYSYIVNGRNLRRIECGRISDGKKRCRTVDK